MSFAARVFERRRPSRSGFNPLNVELKRTLHMCRLPQFVSLETVDGELQIAKTIISLSALKGSRCLRCVLTVSALLEVLSTFGFRRRLAGGLMKRIIRHGGEC